MLNKFETSFSSFRAVYCWMLKRDKITESHTSPNVNFADHLRLKEHAVTIKNNK